MEVDKQATEQYTSNKQINSLLIQKGPDGWISSGEKTTFNKYTYLP